MLGLHIQAVVGYHLLFDLNLIYAFNCRSNSSYVVCASEKDLSKSGLVGSVSKHGRTGGSIRSVFEAIQFRHHGKRNNSKDSNSAGSDSPPDSELDSGISVNVNYEDPRNYRNRLEHLRRGHHHDKGKNWCEGQDN